MTPADEDALIDRVYADWIAGCDSGAKPVSELVRLAIRAAVAAERARALSKFFFCHSPTSSEWHGLQRER